MGGISTGTTATITTKIALRVTEAQIKGAWLTCADVAYSMNGDDGADDLRTFLRALGLPETRRFEVM